MSHRREEREMSHRKRHADDDHRRLDTGKRSHTDDNGERSRSRSRPPHHPRPNAKFPSYLDAADVPPKIRVLCEILSTAPSTSVESVLDSSGIRLTPSDVEEVLKLTYSHPGPAVKFFRWAGALLDHRHSPYSWNLVVDLLGKNLLFDAMWDAVSSMLNERILSLATFASVFSSFSAAGQPDDAFAAFDTMESRFGVPRNTPALNTLLSALCREGRTPDARRHLASARRLVPPDADTFAILLEGCENESDAAAARDTFSDMISLLGWDPANVPAYDSFLTALLRGPLGPGEALKFLTILSEKKCYPGIKFFRKALDELAKLGDSRGALTLWEALAGRNRCYPDTPMYNSLISLLCNANLVDRALEMMDEMVTFGAFPDSQTYNVVLHFLLKGRKFKDAVVLFNEMVKNEFHLSTTNCALAIKSFMDCGDWMVALKVWKSMCGSDMKTLPLEESGNDLVLKLRDLDRLPEACRCAEGMIDQGLKLNSSTLSKLKASLAKIHKTPIYDELLRKWKGH